MKSHRQRFVTALAAVGLMASLFLAAGPANAEPGHGGGKDGGRHSQRFEKMQSELGLSADQTARIKAIFESRKGEFKSMRQQMKSILTPEQQAQMKSWRESRKQGAGERPSREDMKARFEQLGLTDAQRDQMKALRQSMKDDRESVNAQIQAVLTPDQLAKWQAKKSEWRSKHGGGKRRGGSN